ncbi:MAG TPA: response regulator [Blastocatellia bacterium]
MASCVGASDYGTGTLKWQLPAQRLEAAGRLKVREKILVVDDSADTREMMAKLLELESFAVVTAEDGRAGINMAEAEQPDLIITDINMPNLNGIQMIGILRKRSDLGDVPILAITAYGSNIASEAISAGADRALTKPIEFDSLIDGIRHLLIEPRRGRHINGNR